MLGSARTSGRGNIVSLSSFSPSLADPAGSGSLVAAAQWVQGTLLGTVATTVAVIAVASVGLGMLTGRVEIRRGVGAIIGCFVLFGATTIVSGVQSGLSGMSDEAPAYVPAPKPIPATLPPAPRPPSGYDPYAGASMPPQLSR
jgi:type IV secretory pathway VirB2 component (pilin)